MILFYPIQKENPAVPTELQKELISKWGVVILQLCSYSKRQKAAMTPSKWRMSHKEVNTS